MIPWYKDPIVSDPHSKIVNGWSNGISSYADKWIQGWFYYKDTLRFLAWIQLFSKKKKMKISQKMSIFWISIFFFPKSDFCLSKHQNKNHSNLFTIHCSRDLHFLNFFFHTVKIYKISKLLYLLKFFYVSMQERNRGRLLKELIYWFGSIWTRIWKKIILKKNPPRKLVKFHFVFIWFFFGL